MPLSDTITHPFAGIREDTLRDRLRMQGFADVSERDLHDVQLWLRFSPAVCRVGVAMGTVLTSPVIIGLLMPIAATGALYGYNPLDLLYDHAIRRVTGTAPLPPRCAPSRFACLVATVWLGLITTVMNQTLPFAFAKASVFEVISYGSNKSCGFKNIHLVHGIKGQF